jgi:hypothetical protein
MLYVASVFINDPSWSTSLEILKVESTPATVRASGETAMWLPGHTLIVPQEIGHEGTGLRPNNDLPSTKPKYNQS